MDEKNLLINIILSPPTRLEEYEKNYLRYEITEISGKKYFWSVPASAVHILKKYFWSFSCGNYELKIMF